MLLYIKETLFQLGVKGKKSLLIIQIENGIDLGFTAYTYSMVPNNCDAACLFIICYTINSSYFGTTFVTVHKSTYTLIWTPQLFGTLE